MCNIMKESSASHLGRKRIVKMVIKDLHNNHSLRVTQNKEIGGIRSVSQSSILQ